MEARKRTQTDRPTESLPDMEPAVGGGTKAKRQSKIHKGLMMLFELLGSAPPKAIVIISFNCQLDTIYSHVGTKRVSLRNYLN